MKRSQSILTVDSLSKVYNKDGKELRALDNVNFQLNHGEILGIIGRNGAGKSTLLKILSQITSPSSGEISYEGKLTSIIDIGTGFHSDLSGEENIYLSALLLGYSKKEIKKLYKEIVDFSGLHDFMQMPVKQYSSGMYLRLAFSIAFHSKISILLLDEVISVGDTDFRQKCYEKIKELKARGVAIILVSHHLELIMGRCDRCILLDDGKVLSEGNTLDVVNEYYELIDNNKGVNIRHSLSKVKDLNDFSIQTAFPLKIDAFHINELTIMNSSQKITTATNLTFQFNCTKIISEGSFEIAIYITNLNGIRVLLDSFGLRNDYIVQDSAKGDYQVNVTIPANLLSAGIYRLGVMMCANKSWIKEYPEIAKFRVAPDPNSLDETKGMGALIRPNLSWEIIKP